MHANLDGKNDWLFQIDVHSHTRHIPQARGRAMTAWTLN
jgi:hypothetical protein